VTAIDRTASTITVATPYGLPTSPMKPGVHPISCGVEIALDQDVIAGDTVVRVKDGAILQPGDEFAIGEPGNDSRDAQVFVKAVVGNEVTLDSPARINFLSLARGRRVEFRIQDDVGAVSSHPRVGSD
jgi:hypothetical protein